MPNTVSVRRRGRFGRLLSGLLVILAMLLLILAGAAFLVQSRIDPDALRQRIERQALQDTGRTLSLGAVRLQLLPVPTLSATGVALADMPGGARAEMLVADGLSAHLALWPLLHRTLLLQGLKLQRPALLLERTADGRANWRFQPPPRPRTDTGDRSSGGARWQVRVGSLSVRDGTLEWRDDQRHWSGHAAIDRLEASGLDGTRPSLDAAGRHGAAGFGLHAQTGPLLRLLHPAAAGTDAAWPLHLSAESGRDGVRDASLSLDGTATDPARLRGFVLELSLDAPRPAGLDALFPHAAIPALGPVFLQARLHDAAAADASRPLPVADRLRLRAGRADLGALLRRPWSSGLVLKRLSLVAAGANDPLRVDGAGTWRGEPIAVQGTAATLATLQAALTEGASGATARPPAPFALAVSAGDARATLRGEASPSRISVALRLGAPDSRAVLPFGPALSDLDLSATLTLQAPQRLAIDSLQLRSRQLDLSGSGSVVGGPHPVLAATLTSTRLDLDALRAGWVDWPHGDRGDAASPAPAGGRAAPDNVLPPVSAPPAAVPPPGTPATTMAPAPGSPFARLLCCDARIAASADQVRFEGESYRQAAATLSLQNGVLSLSPLSAQGPAGPIAGSLDANAAQRSVALVLHPVTLPAAALARWLGEPPLLDGAVELVGALTATGDSEAALLADTTGHLGASMVDGSVGNNGLGALIGHPGALPGGNGGRTGFRCLALPAGIQHGVASLDRLTLSASHLSVEGHGSVRLSDGALDLHLLPRLLFGGTGASLPVRVGGSLSSPAAAVEATAPGGRFALVIGGGGGAEPDPCPAALAAARYGVPGPLPGVAADGGRHKLPKPIDILRRLGLFR